MVDSVVCHQTAFQEGLVPQLLGMPTTGSPQCQPLQGCFSCREHHGQGNNHDQGLMASEIQKPSHLSPTQDSSAHHSRSPWGWPYLHRSCTSPSVTPAFFPWRPQAFVPWMLLHKLLASWRPHPSCND